MVDTIFPSSSLLEERIYMRLATICFLIEPGYIYLAPKKRGHGVGFLNCYGGKHKRGEHARQCASRELFEEARIRVKQNDLEKVAAIDFFELQNHIFYCDVFFVHNWKGEPQETEEMGVPERFPRGELPFGRMQKGDELWLPQLCRGEKLKGFIRKHPTTKDVIEYSFNPLMIF